MTLLWESYVGHWKPRLVSRFFCDPGVWCAMIIPVVIVSLTRALANCPGQRTLKRTALLLCLVSTSAPAQEPTMPARGPQLGLDREWSRLAGAAAWPDGRVLIAEQTIPELVMFDARGGVRWTAGRQGAGPGEYNALSAVVRCANGDVLVAAAARAQVDRYDTLGTVQGVERGLARGRLVGCRSAGETFWVWKVPALGDMPPPQSWFEIPYLVMRMRGARVMDTVGSSIGLTFLGSSREAGTDNPIGERPYHLVGGGVVYVCQAGSGKCLSASPTGSHRFTLPGTEKQVSAADWQRALAGRKREFTGVTGRSRAIMEEVTQELPRPERFGAFEDAAADDQGRLWVKTYARYGQPDSEWLVLSPTGATLQRHLLPAAVKILSIAGRHIIGQLLTADEIPIVEHFILTQP